MKDGELDLRYKACWQQKGCQPLLQDPSLCFYEEVKKAEGLGGVLLRGKDSLFLDRDNL